MIGIDPRKGNIDDKIMLGDRIEQVSASFGTEVWDAQNFGQVRFIYCDFIYISNFLLHVATGFVLFWVLWREEEKVDRKFSLFLRFFTKYTYKYHPAACIV